MNTNTAKEPTQTGQDALAPAHVPWKTFETFVATLKNTHAPDVIDSGVMPSTMDGSLQRKLRAALKFLGLTDASGKVSVGFAELITAHGTPQWSAAVKEHVLHAYEPIIGDLAIERATSAQLDAKFKGRGVQTGQMLDKSVRFYLHALKSAEVKYSAYWSLRSESTPRKRPLSPKGNAAKKAKQAETTDDDDDKDRHPGDEKNKQVKLLEFPLHFGDKPTGKICVPLDMDEDDMALFDATVAVVKAYSARKKSGSK